MFCFNGFFLVFFTFFPVFFTIVPRCFRFFLAILGFFLGFFRFFLGIRVLPRVVSGYSWFSQFVLRVFFSWFCELLMCFLRFGLSWEPFGVFFFFFFKANPGKTKKTESEENMKPRKQSLLYFFLLSQDGLKVTPVTFSNVFSGMLLKAHVLFDKGDERNVFFFSQWFVHRLELQDIDYDANKSSPCNTQTKVNNSENNGKTTKHKT